MEAELLRAYLGKDLVDKLQSAQDLDLDPVESLETLGYLGDLVTDLSTYIPARLLSRIWPHPDRDPPAFEILRGTIYLADVSGFTALTETLSASGKVGSEEMTGMINRTFESLLALVERYGGDVLKFGGDAFLAFFPENPQTDDADLEGASLCASRTLDLLSNQAPQTTGLGHVYITMSIGIHRGTILATTPGNDSRRDYMVAGPDIVKAAEVELRAPSAQAWVSASSVERYAGSRVSFEPQGEFFSVGRIDDTLTTKLQISQPEQRMPAFASSQLRIAYLVSIADRIRPFLAAPVFEKIKDSPGKVTLESEHRKVTSLFLGLATGIGESTLDETRAASFHAQMTRLIQLIDRTCSRYGGIICSSIPGRECESMLVLLGAPRAHPDDEQRAVSLALDLSRELQTTPGELRWKIGISTGQVFCGNIGSTMRKEYTVIGDSVNLAARLMARAQPGQTLIDEHTERRVRGRFELNALAPLSLKGKRAPVCCFELVGEATAVSDSAKTAVQSVCHQKQFNQAIAVLEQVARGGRTLAVCGDDGIGKRHFAEVLSGVAAHNGFTTLRARVHLGGGHVPYGLWHEPLSALLELEGLGAEQAVSQIGERLGKIRAGLEESAPHLARALGFSPPESAVEPELSPSDRRELVLTAMTAVIVDAFGSKRGLLVLENTHNADELSLAMLEQLQPKLAKTQLMVLATGPREFEVEGPTVVKLVLEELSLDETALLAARHLGVTQIARPLASLLQERTAGNPLYIEELLDELRTSELLNISDGGIARLAGTLSETVLPTGIVGLIMGKIDTLPDSQRSVLKLASCIGSQFDLEMLRDVTAQLEGSSKRVMAAIEAASRIKLIESAGDPEAYEFRHSTARQALYESIAYETRRRYHLAIGRWLENHHFPDLDPYFAILAHHFHESGELRKELDYLGKAAPRFAAASANQQAIQHYARLMRLLEEDPASQDQLVLLYAQYAQVFEREGHYQKALEKYQLQEVHAARLAARAQAEQGKIHLRQGHWREATQFLERALTLFKQTDHAPGTGAVQNHLGQVERSCGNNQEASERFRLAYQTFEGIADQAGMADSLLHQGEVLLDDGKAQEALALLERGHALDAENNRSLSQARGANLIGEAHWALGNLMEAASQFEDAMQLADASLDGFVLSRIFRNLGLVAEQTGEFGLARQQFREALTLHKRMGARVELGLALLDIARMDRQTGKLTSAAELSQKAITLFKRHHSLELELQARTVHADALVDQGKLQAAEVLLQETMRDRPSDRVDLLCQATLAMGRCLFLLGAFGDSLAAYNRIPQLPGHYPAELASAHLGLCEMFLALHSPDPAQDQLELARAQLEHLLDGPIAARLTLTEAEIQLALGKEQAAEALLARFADQSATHRDDLRGDLIRARLCDPGEASERLTALLPGLSEAHYPDLLVRALIELARRSEVDLITHLKRASEIAQSLQSESLLLEINWTRVVALQQVNPRAADKHREKLDQQLARLQQQTSDTMLKSAIKHYIT